MIVTETLSSCIHCHFSHSLHFCCLKLESIGILWEVLYLALWEFEYYSEPRILAILILVVKKIDRKMPPSLLMPLLYVEFKFFLVCTYIFFWQFVVSIMLITTIVGLTLSFFFLFHTALVKKNAISSRSSPRLKNLGDERKVLNLTTYCETYCQILCSNIQWTLTIFKFKNCQI